MTRRKHRLPMSAAMIRAIEREIEAPGTGKTQTRRLVRPQPVREVGGWYWQRGDHSISIPKEFSRSLALPKTAPIQPGDLIAFTETWAFGTGYDELPPREVPECPYIGVWYRADDEPPESNRGRWRPARFMPYWCSRYTGVVTDVRVERVQEIRPADARAEGVAAAFDDNDAWHQFHALWDRTNGSGAWDRNDWVYVYTFRPIAANVLHVEHDPAAYGVGEGA